MKEKLFPYFGGVLLGIWICLVFARCAHALDAPSPVHDFSHTLDDAGVQRKWPTPLQPAPNDYITITSPKCDDGSWAEMQMKINAQQPDRSEAPTWYCHGREIEQVPPMWHYVKPKKGDKPWMGE